jgi:hypothetical protein
MVTSIYLYFSYNFINIFTRVLRGNNKGYHMVEKELKEDPGWPTLEMRAPSMTSVAEAGDAGRARLQVDVVRDGVDGEEAFRDFGKGIMVL